MKYIFNWTSVFGTLFIFMFLWGISKIGVQFEFLNVFEQVFDNFALTDLYYKVRDKDVKFDDRIVMVNIGEKSRGEIALEVDQLNKAGAKVIGIDVFFRKLHPERASQDFALASAIEETENFVLANEVKGLDSASNIWDYTTGTNLLFQQHAYAGFANTVTDEDASEAFNTWKRVKPKQTIKDGRVIPAFAAKVAELYNKKAYDKFIARNNDVESIWFRGNILDPKGEMPSAYSVIEHDDAISGNFDPDVVKDKIVLLGYLGKDINAGNWDEDKFFTPLNEQPVGRAYPDMYGVVIHANIISMILDEKYINEMPPFVGVLFAIIVCYLNMALFVFILKKKRLAPWYGGISKGIQLLEVVILAFLTVTLFGGYLYKADTTLAMLAILVSGDLAEIYMDILGNVFHTHKVEH